MGVHRCKHPLIKREGTVHTCSCGRRYRFNGKHWLVIGDTGCK